MRNSIEVKQQDTEQLTKRECEVVALVAQGLKAAEIASRLFISRNTVRNHLHSIFSKLGVESRLELAIYVHHRRSVLENLVNLLNVSHLRSLWRRT